MFEKMKNEEPEKQIFPEDSYYETDIDKESEKLKDGRIFLEYLPDRYRKMLENSEEYLKRLDPLKISELIDENVRIKIWYDEKDSNFCIINLLNKHDSKQIADIAYCFSDDDKIIDFIDSEIYGPNGKNKAYRFKLEDENIKCFFSEEYLDHGNIENIVCKEPLGFSYEKKSINKDDESSNVVTISLFDEKDNEQVGIYVRNNETIDTQLVIYKDEFLVSLDKTTGNALLCVNTPEKQIKTRSIDDILDNEKLIKDYINKFEKDVYSRDIKRPEPDIEDDFVLYDFDYDFIIDTCKQLKKARKVEETSNDISSEESAFENINCDKKVLVAEEGKDGYSCMYNDCSTDACKYFERFIAFNDVSGKTNYGKVYSRVNTPEENIFMFDDGKGTNAYIDAKLDVMQMTVVDPENDIKIECNTPEEVLKYYPLFEQSLEEFEEEFYERIEKSERLPFQLYMPLLDEEFEFVEEYCKEKLGIEDDEKMES